MKTLKSKKVALSVLALGAASAAVVFGSFAAWTAQTSNNSNSISAGYLTIGNSKPSNAPVLTTNVSNVRPGDASSDTVTITNTGTGLMDVKLSQLSPSDAISDTHNIMKFTIFDGTNCVYPAAPGACPTLTASMGAWTAGAGLTNTALPGGGAGSSWGVGEAHTYTVAWKFTDDGVTDNTKNNTTSKSATFDLQFNGTPH